MVTKKYKIVVIGGGTGSFTVLKGLKKYPQLELTAIVTMTDNGSSTGRLRDEFGTLPVGDVRQCLIALSNEEETGNILRNLFAYRFPVAESSLSGHNFGNLFLTALTDILGSEEAAIAAASKILQISGEIIPVTTNNVDLVAEYENGDVLYGEKNIDEPQESQHDCCSKVKRLWTQPKAYINPRAKTAILAADAVIIGPGDLYSSLLSNIVVLGMDEAIQNSKAQFIYITNLVSKYGQTHNLSKFDYIRELEKYSGRKPDIVLDNSTELPQPTLELYARENSFPITDDLGDKEITVVKKPLLAEELVSRNDNDSKVKRSLIRHDSDKLAQAIMEIIKTS